MPPQFFAYLVILCIERGYPKQNTAIRPKIKHFGPKNTLGELRHWLKYDEKRLLDFASQTVSFLLIAT